MPPPALEAPAQAGPPCEAKAAWLHALSPLAEMTRFFGSQIWMRPAVSAESVFVMVSRAVAAFGFFFVPALPGLT